MEAVVASLKMETELAISEESKAKEEFHSKEIQQGYKNIFCSLIFVQIFFLVLQLFCSLKKTHPAESAEALQNKKSELEKLQNDVMEADLLIVSIGHECETKNGSL